MKLTIDLETRSPVDLKKCGTHVYAEHELTDVICLAIKKDAESPRIWLNPRFDKDAFTEEHRTFEFISEEEITALVEEASEIEAHNAAFEKALWNGVLTRYGFAPLPEEKVYCSAARAAAVSLPRALGYACKALGLTEQKDYSGYLLMLKMCKPRKPTKAELLEIGKAVELHPGIWGNPKGGERFCFWQEDPCDLINLCNYCCQDVNSEYDLSEHIPHLIPRERKVFLIDQVINDRGIQVDVEGAKKLVAMVKDKEQRLLLEVDKLTMGKIKSARQTAKLKEWLSDQDIELENVKKETVLEVMKGIPEGVAKRVLEIRQSLSKASVSKFDALLRMANKDQRVRGMFLYHGAGTGRFTGKGLQVQNLKRESLDEDVLEAILTLSVEDVESVFDCPIILASKCVRGMLMAKEGHELVACDLNAIESRVLAWLAGDERMISNFLRSLDPYKIAAEGIYGVSYANVDKEQRQIGKVAELALGYQGHVGAFTKMAEGYGVKIKIGVDPMDREGIFALLNLEEEEEKKIRGLTNAELYGILYEKKVAEICNKWRRSRPAIVSFWANMENAAIDTIESKQPHNVGRIQFSIQNKFLMMRLPSGRSLAYYNPSTALVTRNKKTKKAIYHWGSESSGGKKMEWTKQTTYGGKLVENAVQAVSRDILVESMARIEKAGLPIVLHVHDETVSECPIGKVKLEYYEKLMATTPPWALGLPLKAKGWIGKRYRKD